MDVGQHSCIVRQLTSGIFKQGISQDTAELVVTVPQAVGISRLSADGAWILIVEESPGATANPAHHRLTRIDRLMRIPASGGVPQFVLETRNWNNTECARAPARLCVILETSQDRKQLVITAFDPLKGRGKVLRTIEITPSHSDPPSALSPDGSTFAVSRVGEAEIHISLLSLSGGSDRQITVKGWPSITGIDWSADGKGFYCGSVSRPLGGQ